MIKPTKKTSVYRFLLRLKYFELLQLQFDLLRSTKQTCLASELLGSYLFLFVQWYCTCIYITRLTPCFVHVCNISARFLETSCFSFTINHFTVFGESNSCPDCGFTRILPLMMYQISDVSISHPNVQNSCDNTATIWDCLGYT